MDYVMRDMAPPYGRAEDGIMTPGEPLRDERRSKDPQSKLDDFWKSFSASAPGYVTNVIPRKSHTSHAIKNGAAEASGLAHDGVYGLVPVESSYEAARAACVAKVAKIVKECRRINQKYRDPHFDLELDLKRQLRFCLESLDNRIPLRQDMIDRRRRRDSSPETSSDEGSRSPRRLMPHPGPPPPIWRNDEIQPPGRRFRPLSVKRVTEIFDEPKFFIEGATASDVRQGRDGDCWLMAALCTISYKPELIEKVCVARDEAVGVYGFVFFRDGEWFSEIIDDKLYLIKADYDDMHAERASWEDVERPNSEEAYRKTYQSNSSALYFAQCANPNETWLPLLEKAYAKAHGDYAALGGGHTGEGIEDLTGGIPSELFTTDILDKEYFWKEELMKANEQFLFGCSTGLWGSGWGKRRGIYEGHAYSVMRAVEMDGERLVLLRNPWGKGEWTGAWSDGSKEWTPEWLQKLGHRFGDDGAFWISYQDLLRKYSVFDRTRLFGPDWKVATAWTALQIPWMLEYHDTKFSFTLTRPGPVVIVLSQLDNRYFRGLEGEYRFRLSFRVHEAGEEDYIVRSQTPYYMNRATNVELNLEPGEYHVLVRVDAVRRDGLNPAETVVKDYVRSHREKVIRIGLSYEAAHAKAAVVETAEEKAARQAHTEKLRNKERERIRQQLTEIKEKRYRYAIRDREKRIEKTKKRNDKHAKAMQQREVETEQNSALRYSSSDSQPSSRGAPGEMATPDMNLVRDRPPSNIKEAGQEPSVSLGLPENKPPSPAVETQHSENHGPTKSTATGKPNIPDEALETAALPYRPRETYSTKEQFHDPGNEGITLQQTSTRVPLTHDTNLKQKNSRQPNMANSRQPPDMYGPVQRRPNPAFPKDQAPRRRRGSNPRPPGGMYMGDYGAPSYIDRGYSSDVSSMSDVSERDIDERMEDYDRMRRATPAPSPIPAPMGPQGPRDRMDREQGSPWNAVAVVGLRVYVRVPEEAGDEEVLKLRVMRPSPYDPSDDENTAKHGKQDGSGTGKDGKAEAREVDEVEVLDFDDAAKDATVGAEG